VPIGRGIGALLCAEGAASFREPVIVAFLTGWQDSPEDVTQMEDGTVMSDTINAALRRGTIVGGLAMIAAAASGCGGDIEPGELRGSIGFASPSPAVVSYLTANPPQTGGSVIATNVTDASQTATGPYTIQSGTTPPEVGQYVLNPNVDPSGSTFFMQVANLAFQDGATYRIGASSPGLSGTWTTPVVNPGTPATVFDLDDECAVLATITVNATGTAEDLDALDAVVVCTVVATVRENPGLPTTFTAQATSNAVVSTVSTLRNGGVQIPILVRSGQPVQFSVGCLFQSSDPGFPQNPALPPGTVVFGGQATPIDVACADSPAVSIDVEVRRNSGRLKGLLDVVGHSLAQFDVELIPSTFRVSEAVTGEAPPHNWQFDSAPSGSTGVSARALLEGGTAWMRFPQLLNADQVQIPNGGEFDLRRRFVVQPFALQTAITLRDPVADTLLTHLELVPFSTFTTGTDSTSFVRADGDTDYFFDSEGNRGASGIGGLAFSKLNGAFDAAAQRADLTADLLLLGLNERDGSTSGAPALPANWRPKEFNVRLRQQNVFSESVQIDPSISSLITALPGETGTFLPLDVCFGEATLQLRAPSGFRLFSPSVTALTSPVLDATDENGVALRYSTARGTAQSAPFGSGNAAQNVAMRVALPAFIRYQLQSRVSLLNDSTSTATSVTLPVVSVPEERALRCGERVAECNFIDENGVATRLTAEITSGDVSCDPGDVGVTGRVQVTGPNAAATLQSVTLQWDGDPPIELCGAGSTPCTNPLVFTHSVGDQSPGLHTVVLTATDSNGCVATDAITITVQPIPVLTCPPRVITQLIGQETEVPYDRIASQLQAQWVGGCTDEFLPPIQDDHPAGFARGETTVRFFSEPNTTPAGEQECETIVEVLPPGGCISFNILPLGDLTQPTMIGDVLFTPQPNRTCRVKDEFPPFPEPDDGELELQIGEVEALLPFEAEWISVRYVKAHSQPLTIEMFNAANELVRTWQSPGGGPDGEPERLRLTRVIINRDRPVNRLRLKSSESELFLISICYTRFAPPPPQPGDVILVPPSD